MTYILTVINYEIFTKRLLSILESDSRLGIIRQFRLGDVSTNPLHTDKYPLIYTTTATNPVVSKKSLYSSDYKKLPGQEVELEFWVIIICRGQSPKAVQSQLFELESIVTDILEENVQLRNTKGKDPLCAESDIYTQKRLEKSRGDVVESMTVRVRPILYTERS